MYVPILPRRAAHSSRALITARARRLLELAECILPRAHVNDEPNHESDEGGHGDYDDDPGDVLEEVGPLPVEEHLMAVAVEVEPHRRQAHLRRQRHLR